jgi:hypothetical protein
MDAKSVRAESTHGLFDVFSALRTVWPWGLFQREESIMANNKFARFAGFGGILAGIIWAALILYDQAGGSVFDGEVWDYLGVLAAALVLVLALALYLQGGDNRPGTLSLLLLAAGMVALIVSVILYAIRFDYEDSAAFGFFFLGTVVQGLGLATLGGGFRSGDLVPSWGTVLMILGVYLALVFPLFFILSGILDIEISDGLAGATWISALFAQALGWMVLGMVTLTVYGEPAERPVESTG